MSANALDEDKLHRIFVCDPKGQKEYLEKYVQVTMETGETLCGTVYTIDPVSECIVLIARESTNSFSMKFIMKQCVKSLKVCKEVPMDQENMKPVIDTLYEKKALPSKTAMVKIRNDLKSWFSKNMIPVSEEGDILKVESVEIHPPYGWQQCFSGNSIVLARIQNLIQAIPVETEQDIHL